MGCLILMSAYAELVAASNFSFLRGASRPEELADAASALGYKALAICDRNTVAGVVRAHKPAKEKARTIFPAAALSFRKAWKSPACRPTAMPGDAYAACSLAAIAARRRPNAISGSTI